MPRSVAGVRARRLEGQQGRVRSQLQGVAGVRKLIKQLPTAVKDEMADTLEDFGPEYLRAQLTDVPRKTGALAAGLSYKVLRASLRLRVGLLGTKRGRAKLFYGFIVEVGRKAKTVTVTRRGAQPYKLRVREMAPRPFVYKKRPELRTRLNNRLSVFWEHALQHAGEGTGIDG
jgi:hypothetical protein